MRKNRPAGQDLVEYALLVPIFLILMLIIVDFGRVTFYYATLNNVAREGARYGVIPVHHDQTSQVDASARSHAFGLDSTDLNIQVTWYHPDSVSLTTHYVRVNATYSFVPIILDLGRWFFDFGELELSATSTMHLEY
jgi:Flp pilus assembly protein TadG